MEDIKVGAECTIESYVGGKGAFVKKVLSQKRIVVEEYVNSYDNFHDNCTLFKQPSGVEIIFYRSNSGVWKEYKGGRYAATLNFKKCEYYRNCY